MALPTNPHDALFRALLDNPADAGTLIREQLPPGLAARLTDRSPILRDGTFVDDSLAETRADRLYEVELADGSAALVYVLLEHKSQPDPRTPVQLLGYMARIWSRYIGRDMTRATSLPPIVPLVIYHGAAPWTIPDSVFACLSGDAELKAYMRHFSYIVRDIGRVDERALSGTPHIRAVLQALIYGTRDNPPDDGLVDVLATLPDGSVLLLQMVRYILTVFKSLSAADVRRIISAAKPKQGDELVSLALQEWLDEARREAAAMALAKGKAEGKAEGRVTGLVDGLREALIDVLEQRFGAVDEVGRERIAMASPDRLRSLIRYAATAPTLAAVFDQPPHA